MQSKRGGGGGSSSQGNAEWQQENTGTSEAAREAVREAEIEERRKGGGIGAADSSHFIDCGHCNPEWRKRGAVPVFSPIHDRSQGQACGRAGVVPREGMGTKARGRRGQTQFLVFSDCLAQSIGLDEGDKQVLVRKKEKWTQILGYLVRPRISLSYSTPLTSWLSS